APLARQAEAHCSLRSRRLDSIGISDLCTSPATRVNSARADGGVFCCWPPTASTVLAAGEPWPGHADASGLPRWGWSSGCPDSETSAAGVWDLSLRRPLPWPGQTSRGRAGRPGGAAHRRFLGPSKPLIAQTKSASTA
ncbi:unnamed protein product, partial [Prorocentrum cordatum]